MEDTGPTQGRGGGGVWSEVYPQLINQPKYIHKG